MLRCLALCAGRGGRYADALCAAADRGGKGSGPGDETKTDVYFASIQAQLSHHFLFLLWTLNAPLDWNVAKVMSHFGSVLQTMLSLYMAVTGGNDWSLYYSLLEQLGSFYHTLFIAQPGCVSLRHRQKWVESIRSQCSHHEQDIHVCDTKIGRD